MTYRNNETVIDMHTHSNYSDGDLFPQELIKLAIDKNVGTLAMKLQIDNNTRNKRLSLLDKLH